MTPSGLHNGVAIEDPAHAVPVDDRGLNYGDGLFETALMRNGEVRFLDAHLQRLRDGCNRLRIDFPVELAADIATLSSAHREGVLKIVVTRGAGGRGYRPEPNSQTHRILTVHPVPAPSRSAGLTLRWCETHLSRNLTLAGMKHLNRLEQVLA